MRCRQLVVGIIALGIGFAFAAPASATSFDNRPKLLLHVKSKTTKNPCSFGSVNDCQASTVVKANLTNVNDPNTFYFVYLLAVKASIPNLAGVQCGIQYEGGADPNGGQVPINVASWSNCATLEFPTPGADAWPAPGGGNLITWDSMNACQTGEVGVAGYFYLGAYAPATMRLTTRPVDNKAALADCSSVESEPLLTKDLGFVAFSAGAVTEGCNPCVAECMPVPVAPTSWSSIKSLLGR
ncbi:MAG TPA: hypothetical protein VF720_08890 [Candidatus Eisenbacteria bacterium]